MTNPAPSSAPLTSAKHFNESCACIRLDRELLPRLLDVAAGEVGAISSLLPERPHLFADLPVFLERADVEAMGEVALAVEEVVESPSYRGAALAVAPPAAHAPAPSTGVLSSYDFHLGPGGPRLIEINTNAGGVLLAHHAARALRAGEEACPCWLNAGGDTFEADLVEMFRVEWRVVSDRPLRTVAIVDERPSEQFLHPEMLLYAALLRRHGIEASVVDPSRLVARGDGLALDGSRVDLVYNRLTDFALERPEHRALRDAHVEGRVLLTPHPRGHALFADKRNLTLLSDSGLLESWGVSPTTVAALGAGVPWTRPVTPDSADDLWARRKGLFFKPAAGFGSRGAFRGDKLTRRVWGEIVEGDTPFVAQELVHASERASLGELPEILERRLKVDVRYVVYGREPLALLARTYQGQTTNLRTVGGGLAPILVLPAAR